MIVKRGALPLALYRSPLDLAGDDLARLPPQLLKFSAVGRS